MRILRVTAIACLLTVAAAPLAGAKSPPPLTQLGGLEQLYPWPEDPNNVLQNGSFESLTTSWRVTEPTFVFSTTATAFDGASSLQSQDSNLATLSPMASQPLTIPGGWYSIRGRMKGTDVGVGSTFAGGRFSLYWPSGGASSNVLRGTADWQTFERRSIAVPAGVSTTFRAEAYGKPTGTIFFDAMELHRQIPPAVQGFVTYPNYRGVLFTDRSQVISLDVTVAPEEVGLTLARSTVRVVLETSSGLVVGMRSVVPPSRTFTLSGDASLAPVGPLRLRLQLLDRSGTVQFEYPAYDLVKMTPAQRTTLKAWIDSDNVFVRGNQRQFVLGLYDTTGFSNSPSYYEPRISTIAQAPINMYLNYWLGAAPPSSLNALMGTLGRYGMAYLHTVNNFYPDNPDWPAKTTCGKSTAAMLGADGFTACIADQIGTNPVMAGWYTVDEETADVADRVFHQYTVLRQHDIDGVAFAVQTNPLELSRWRDTVDVIGVDPYPIFNVPLGSPSPLEMVTSWIETAVQAVDNRRPVWAVIQYFQFGASGHFPTYDELRTMSYMAIVAGAKGLFYWSYGVKGLTYVTDPVMHQQLWQELIDVTTEIKSLEPALLSPDAPELIQSAAPANTIRWLAKQVDDVRYLIAVNNTNTAVTGSFTLASPAESIAVLGESRSIESDDGLSFTDAFAPYDVHVYQIGS